MMKSTGRADLPLHTGTVPRWLADRMRDLGDLIVEALLVEGGKDEFLRRLADPLWFQSFGAVLGMDWHSSGITTSVMYALKRALNPRAREFGLCVCGGRGKYSRKTPEELLWLSGRTGLDGDALVRASRLCAKIDNTAVQDGFQLYQHNFVVADNGNWTVVQQGMNTGAKAARRYHWCSQNLRSFSEEPHSAVTGENQGMILNLTDRGAAETKKSILALSNENPAALQKELGLIRSIQENRGTLFPQEEKDGQSCSPATPGLTDGRARRNPRTFPFPGGIEKSETPCADSECGRDLVMPARHHLLPEDVDTKRLGAVLTAAYESRPADFESLVLTPGLGPRTLQSLCLVSEVIYGTPSRFRDPARFSFAHGGKDGHPFPVPTRVYDESIRVLGDAVRKAKLGYTEKSECIRRLHQAAREIERHCDPQADFYAALEHERANSSAWGGRTVDE